MNSFHKNKHAWIFLLVAICGVTAIGFFLASGDSDPEYALEDATDGVTDERVSSESQDMFETENTDTDLASEPKGTTEQSPKESTESVTLKHSKVSSHVLVDEAGEVFPEDQISQLEEQSTAQIEEELEEELPACVVASFEADKNILKKSQVLELPKEVKEQTFCLLVDNKPIKATPVDRARSLDMDWVPTRKSAKVEMIFCRDKGNCPLKCEKPEEDFWDELDVETVANTEEGFLQDETAQEEKLSKELAKLKTLLSEKNTKRAQAVWKVASREPIECASSKLGGR